MTNLELVKKLINHAERFGNEHAVYQYDNEFHISSISFSNYESKDLLLVEIKHRLGNASIIFRGEERAEFLKFWEERTSTRSKAILETLKEVATKQEEEHLKQN